MKCKTMQGNDTEYVYILSTIILSTYKTRMIANINIFLLFKLA